MSATAASLNELGNDLKDEGRFAEAERAYVRATEAAPWWSVPWYNLGLLYKIQLRWEDSVRCNQRALELDPEDGDAWWNLGIAATALGNWTLARRAWQGCGIEMPGGEDEPQMNYGLVPIRLNPQASGEVVWCDRIDPARAIIRNIPLPGSGYREGDLLLHDGAPNGYRIWEGQQYPVFDALQVLIPSERTTYQALVEAATEEALEVLHQLAARAGVVLEDWETLTWMCRQCSEGVPHEVHDRTPGPWKPQRRLAISAHSEAQVSRLLGDWTAAARGARVLSV